MHRVFAITLALVACGGPRGPRKPEPKALAAALSADLHELHAIAVRLEGQCDPLVAALRPHIAKMRGHADEVKVAMDDPALAPQLKREVRAYDQQNVGLSDRTAESLAKTVHACNQDKRVLELVDQIPVL